MTPRKCPACHGATLEWDERAKAFLCLGAGCGYSFRPARPESQPSPADRLATALRDILPLAEFGWLHVHPSTKDEEMARIRRAREVLEEIGR